jgi:hypothetical protein
MALWCGERGEELNAETQRIRRGTQRKAETGRRGEELNAEVRRGYAATFDDDKGHGEEREKRRQRKGSVGLCGFSVGLCVGAL